MITPKPIIHCHRASLPQGGGDWAEERTFYNFLYSVAYH